MRYNCIVKFNSIILFSALALVAVRGAFAAHPCVYFRAADLPALRVKAENVDWARAIVAKWHREVDSAVSRHVDDPSFAPSRLQMNWTEGRRYTRCWTNGNFIPRREGNAKYPTVRIAYARTWGDCPYRSVPWESNPRYATDDGCFLNNKPTDFPGNLVPIEHSGMAAELVNEKLLDMAYKSAILYSLEGDEKHAKFAADIVWTIVRGGAQQEEINPGAVDNCGFLSWETLGDSRRYWTIPLVWDMLYAYFNSKYFKSQEFANGIPGEMWCPGHPEGAEWASRQFEIFFKKFIDNKLNRGGGLLGNWNMNEQQSAMLYALALEPDAKYADGKGRRHYVKALVRGPTTERHGAYCDVLRANIDPVTGLWPEAPGGYGQGSICQLVKFAFLYWKNGLDILARDALLEKASRSTLQMLHSNGYVANVGDASYAKMWGEQLEFLLAYHSTKGDEAAAAKCASFLEMLGKRNLNNDIAFFFYLPSISRAVSMMPPTAVSSKPPYRGSVLSRVSYAPLYPTIVERNPAVSGDMNDALSFALSGASLKMGHRHANGISLELCARGEIFAPDPGAGSNYWSDDNRFYYHNVAAHNTVVPNGMEADDARPLDFTVVASEPAAVAGADVFESKSPYRQYVTVEGEFVNRGMVAKQRRTVAIIRTGKKTGYFLDVFKSKVERGGFIETALPKGEYHDYLLHLLGDPIEVIYGRECNTVFDGNSGYGYSYFTEAKSYDAADGWSGSVCYSDALTTRVFIPSQAKVAGTVEKPCTAFTMLGPKVFRHYDASVKSRPCPTLMVRQEGEAWRHPFVAVIEPCADAGSGIVERVEQRSLSTDGVEITVWLKGGRRDVVTLSCDGKMSVATFSGKRQVGKY